jgi:alkylhydroperoxidase family enzyme
MSAPTPRIPPPPPERLSDEQKTLTRGWEALNFSRVIVEHPGLYRALMPLIAKLVAGSDLPPRDREILVLRTLALCGETYEAAHHALIARKAGLSEAEIAAARGDGEGLAPFERTLVRAADELVADHALSDATWAALAERYSQIALMEVAALVGGYVLMAMLTKSFGIPLEDAETFNRFMEIRTYT